MSRALSLRLPWLRIAASASLAIALAGCHRGPALHPVRGQVWFEGRPAEGATVVFHPAQSDDAVSLTPSATVEPNGSFALSTRLPGDGAPAGAEPSGAGGVPTASRTT